MNDSNEISRSEETTKFGQQLCPTHRRQYANSITETNKHSMTTETTRAAMMADLSASSTTSAGSTVVEKASTVAITDLESFY